MNVSDESVVGEDVGRTAPAKIDVGESFSQEELTKSSDFLKKSHQIKQAYFSAYLNKFEGETGCFTCNFFEKRFFARLARGSQKQPSFKSKFKFWIIEEVTTLKFELGSIEHVLIFYSLW